MKKSLLVLIILVMASTSVNAECPLNCIFQPGTICVNGVCVPKITPTPTPTPTNVSEIKLDLLNQLVVSTIDCKGMDLKNVKVIGKRKTPPPPASYYSSIFYYQENTEVIQYFAQKDILNRYVFLHYLPSSKVPVQFQGFDFVFNTWDNPAFKEFFATKTCEELKQSKLFFSCGISIKGDMTDFEGMIFTFK